MDYRKLPDDSDKKQQDFYLQLRDKVKNWFEGLKWL